jgi:hypothetical protein
MILSFPTPVAPTCCTLAMDDEDAALLELAAAFDEEAVSAFPSKLATVMPSVRRSGAPNTIMAT